MPECKTSWAEEGSALTKNQLSVLGPPHPTPDPAPTRTNAQKHKHRLLCPLPLALVGHEERTTHLPCNRHGCAPHQGACCRSIIGAAGSSGRLKRLSREVAAGGQ